VPILKRAVGNGWRVQWPDARSTNKRRVDIFYLNCAGSGSDRNCVVTDERRISAAERAAILRFKELENSADHHEELIALTDALTALKILGESDWAD